MLDRMFSQDNLGYEIELPEDSSVWTGEINRVLFTTFPELANFPVKLAIDKFEPQKLYAKGSFAVDINSTRLTIPVIIRNKKLQPFDIGLVGEDWAYLTNDLIQDLINGNQSLGEHMDNKDVIDFYSQPIKNDVPYYTGNRNTRVVTASVISTSDKEELAKKVLSDIGIKTAAEKNPAFKNVLSETLASTCPTLKTAFVSRKGFTDAVILISDRFGKREKVSTSFSNAKSFVQRHAPEKYVEFIKQGSVSLLDDDESNSMALGGVGSALKHLLRKITGPGMFSAMSENGPAPLMVIKIKSVGKGPGIGGGMGLGKLLGIGAGGMLHNVDDMEATPCEKSSDNILSTLDKKQPEELISGDEALIQNGSDYLEPISVEKSIQLPIGRVVIGIGKESGSPFVGIFLSKFDKTKTAASYEELLPKHVAPTLIAPSAKIYKVASRHKQFLCKTAREFVSNAAAKMDSIKVLRRTPDSFAIKLSGENIQASREEVPFYLNSMGVSTSDAASLLKTAAADGQALALIPRRRVFKNLFSKETRSKIASVDWLKVAAYLDNEESVDSALALNYMSDDTVAEFYESLPVYKKALSDMAKLMASVRLGNTIVPEEVLRNAMEALSELISELTIYREGV